MKRLLAIVVVVTVLTGLTAVTASATPRQKQQESSLATAGHEISSTVAGVGTVIASYPVHCLVESTIFGIDVLSAVFSGGAWRWLAGGSATWGASQLQNDASCGGEAYGHLGYRQLCVQQHFIGWLPGTTKAMFAYGPEVCHHSPVMLDDVWCNYIVASDPRLVAQQGMSCVYQAVYNVAYGLASAYF